MPVCLGSPRYARDAAEVSLLGHAWIRTDVIRRLADSHSVRFVTEIVEKRRHAVASGGESEGRVGVAEPAAIRS